MESQMTYMESAHISVRIEQLINGTWHLVEENVGVAGYLLIKGKKDYRAVAPDGHIVRNEILDGVSDE